MADHHRLNQAWAPLPPPLLPLIAVKDEVAKRERDLPNEEGDQNEGHSKHALQLDHEWNPNSNPKADLERAQGDEGEKAVGEEEGEPSPPPPSLPPPPPPPPKSSKRRKSSGRRRRRRAVSGPGPIERAAMKAARAAERAALTGGSLVRRPRLTSSHWVDFLTLG